MDATALKEEIAQCTRLRDRLKEQGLRWTMEKFNEEERSYARRRFREALATHIAHMEASLASPGS